MFYSSSETLLDKNGRVKISVEYLDFFAKENLDIVLHCNDDGALVIYPKSKWEEFKLKVEKNLDEDFIEDRMKRRRLYGLTKPTKISNQGRITIPSVLRKKSSLEVNTNITLSAVGDYLEIWNTEIWNKIIEVKN